MADDLVGIGEVADMLGLTRQRVDQLSRQRDFPEPAHVLSGGRIWRRADVKTWAKAVGRTIQNPTKQG